MLSTHYADSAIRRRKHIDLRVLEGVCQITQKMAKTEHQNLEQELDDPIVAGLQALLAQLSIVLCQ